MQPRVERNSTPCPPIQLIFFSFIILSNIILMRMFSSSSPRSRRLAPPRRKRAATPPLGVIAFVALCIYSLTFTFTIKLHNEASYYAKSRGSKEEAKQMSEETSSNKTHKNRIFHLGLRGRGGPSPQQQQQQQQHQQQTRIYKPNYSNFNTSFPPILYASSPGSLPSLPDIHRIPRHVLQGRNFTEHYAKWDLSRGDPHTLFVYNPSIVPLFPTSSSSSSASTADGDEAQEGSNSPLFWGNDDNIQYLATFCISSVHSCGFPTYAFWKHPVDYLGVALLTDKLQVAPVWGNNNSNNENIDEQSTTSLDIIVDINAHLPKIFHGGRRKVKVQDVRLFTIDDRVFMSSGEYLIPICVAIIATIKMQRRTRIMALLATQRTIS